MAVKETSVILEIGKTQVTACPLTNHPLNIAPIDFQYLTTYITARWSSKHVAAGFLQLPFRAAEGSLVFVGAIESLLEGWYGLQINVTGFLVQQILTMEGKRISSA